MPCLFLHYIVESEKLPFAEISVMVSNQYEDADILAIVRERLKKLTKHIRINIDNL